ncbi:MAG: DedA family protein [Acidiferrobacteraceae bacterium]|nr:DedA family protein [Acidiferrobacteraceae bacterium]MBT4405836.1 DedA family protein [Acidiferrobacteraceae bacterium]MBT5623640.1 DedA family protein [Acidiferrobacteraceae bacterium]MBT7181728.1 DedA family protein [Acidiferrobacteraceae bacterium]MBT7518141.1 DedA family protein [Acidiferrobacteraceae bacterium]
MKIFTPLYSAALRWATHRHASRYLSALSFAESSFFPIPPDVMLAPMVLARRDRAWFLAGLTTVASVAGGLFGYLIGKFLFGTVAEPIIEFYDARSAFERARTWFEIYGVWVVFIAGFTPIPYKIFTISAGLIGMSLVPFMLASLVGRGARFFLVAGLILLGGEALETQLRRHVDAIGWVTVVVLVSGLLWLSG